MRRIECSLIISTYNWPQALRLCLDSVLRQTVLPSEIIIADDGSKQETFDLVRKFQGTTSIPVKHVWQPDEGYQLARIRNKAFAEANDGYLIQIDGDLILHPKFIEDHLHFSKPGTFVSGARAMLDGSATKKMLQHFDSDLLKVGSTHLSKKFNAVYLRPLSHLNYLVQRSRSQIHYVLGCNMAFWKKDLIAVNGYNESFVGWGKEDNDLAIRLVNNNTSLRFVKFGAIVYHLHHKISVRPTLAENEAMLKKSIDDKATFIEKGMNQHKPSSINI